MRLEVGSTATPLPLLIAGSTGRQGPLFQLLTAQ